MNKKITGKSNWDSFWKNTSRQKEQISWSKKRICNILDRYADSGLTVLDAGSGSGFFSSYFIGSGCKTYSLDYSDTALELTRSNTENKSESYILMDLLTPQFNQHYSKTFDIIFSDGLLEHFSPEQQEQIICNWKNAKKDDGIIISVVPNRYSAWEIIRPLFMPGIEETPFTMSQLEKVHQQQGLKVLECGGINTIPLPLSPDKYIGKWLGMLLFIIAK